MMPDEQTLRCILSSGRDTWAAELLGASREFIRRRRVKCGVAAFARGGSDADRRSGRTAFMERWAPVLTEQGIITPDRAQALLRPVPGLRRAGRPSGRSPVARAEPRAAGSEVLTYRMSQAEIAERYGPPGKVR